MNLVTTIKICFVVSYVFLYIHAAPVLSWTSDISEQPAQQSNQEDVMVQNYQRLLGTASTSIYSQDDEDLVDDVQKQNQKLNEKEKKVDTYYLEDQDYGENLEDQEYQENLEEQEYQDQQYYDSDENDQYHEEDQKNKDEQDGQDHSDHGDEGDEKDEIHLNVQDLIKNETTQKQQEYEKDASDQYFHFKVDQENGEDYQDFEINPMNKYDENYQFHQDNPKIQENSQEQNKQNETNRNQGLKDVPDQYNQDDQEQKSGRAEQSEGDDEEDKDHEKDVPGEEKYHNNNHDQYQDKHDVLNHDEKNNQDQNQNDYSKKQNQKFEYQTEKDLEFEEQNEDVDHYYDDEVDYYDDGDNNQNQFGDGVDLQDQEHDEDQRDEFQIPQGSQEKYIEALPVPSNQNRSDSQYDRPDQNNKDDQDHNIKVSISLPAIVEVKLRDIDCTANVVFNNHARLNNYVTAVDRVQQGAQLEPTFLTTNAENVDPYIKVNHTDETHPGRDSLDFKSTSEYDENQLLISNVVDVVDLYEPDESDYNKNSSGLMMTQNVGDSPTSGKNEQ